MGNKETSTTAHKVHKKEIVQEILPEQHFMLCNGTSVKSINELALLMDKLSDEEFSFHVNDNKNDFSNWIRDVFDQSNLADGLSKTTCKKESQIYLLKHVVTDKR